MMKKIFSLTASAGLRKFLAELQLNSLRAIKPWLPVLIWMAIIFLFSANPDPYRFLPAALLKASGRCAQRRPPPHPIQLHRRRTPRPAHAYHTRLK
jgi:hypothetical protein